MQARGHVSRAAKGHIAFLTPLPHVDVAVHPGLCPRAAGEAIRHRAGRAGSRAEAAEERCEPAGGVRARQRLGELMPAPVAADRHEKSDING